jgi:hypothetical protein
MCSRSRSFLRAVKRAVVSIIRFCKRGKLNRIRRAWTTVTAEAPCSPVDLAPRDPRCSIPSRRTRSVRGITVALETFIEMRVSRAELAPVMANSPPPPEQPLQSNNYERFSSPPIQNAQHASYGYANQQPLQPQPQAFLPQQQPPVNYWGGGGAQGAAGPSWANDATAQMGMQFGRSAVQAGTDYVEKNVRERLPA